MKLNLQTIASILTITSFMLTMNFYIGNPVGLPLKYQMAPMSFFPTVGGWEIDIPVFASFISIVAFIIWLYIRKKK